MNRFLRMETIIEKTNVTTSYFIPSFFLQTCSLRDNINIEKHVTVEVRERSVRISI